MKIFNLFSARRQKERQFSCHWHWFGMVSADRSFMDKPRNTILQFPRSAGILLHITSLPSPYGIGDLGPEAYQFADFLYRSHQSFWQLLPLNPTTTSQGHSPYSAYSSMAGNPLLISPALLYKSHLLDEKDLSREQSVSGDKVDFESVSLTKKRLLKKAFDRYTAASRDQDAYQEFCDHEKYWLDDFALYTVLRLHHDHQPWYRWPDPYKHREQQALKTFSETCRLQIDQCKWEQMIFHQQWHELRVYCAALNIKLFGDLPFYVGQDSADVWSHRDIFAITKSGELTGVAGVPPDAFSETGQRWGMPVFKWNVLKDTKYSWWITRLRKNMEFFDLLRLDHFRAFSSYWQVPAEEETAVNGEWHKGPGEPFFREVNAELGSLPFVAEDLGKIDNEVLELRDSLGLPGMNVLHFTFGKNMPYNSYIPHHHRPDSITYTGTHDNNTTLGWYKKLTMVESENLSEFLARRVTPSNVCKLLNRLAYSSVAQVTVLPMQDVLELDEDARMNSPASAENNWTWRLDKSSMTTHVETILTQWCRLFDRSPRLRQDYLRTKMEDE